MLQVEDESVLRLLYDEAKLNIIEGRYPCDPEHWTRLAALSCAIEIGAGLDDQQLTSAIRYTHTHSAVRFSLLLIYKYRTIVLG